MKKKLSILIVFLFSVSAIVVYYNATGKNPVSLTYQEIISSVKRVAAVIGGGAVEKEEAVQAIEVIEELGVEPAAVIGAVQAIEVIEELEEEPAAVIE